ncbi:peptide chain release factor N(5)-glutamine methyltransferase [uncultured Psychroserpens sp.]|uniref:peptide chain release factor N(5)-glutamine methyltransferase n=1 Tax=uncultured Psychroserpens sp. TaxID=255436 RepID=UPI00262F76E1|nr:peptide chain release factor N(5)-glutamine methyltransferase [uncultured Psychroserpens sp.]
MRLNEVVALYHKVLDAVYGETEVKSFVRLLIEHYLDINHLHLVLNPNFEVNKHQKQQFLEALEFLKQEKPIQYIIGETEFYGLTFKVNEHTLIPRPETEELVDLIIKDTEARSPKILDIGTGSGCIAVTLAKQIPNAKLQAIDVSTEALDMAQKNAMLNAVTVDFIQKDILLADHSKIEFKEPFDIIVSNPPYIRDLEKKEIRPNVLNYEPHQALFVNDNNPLQFYTAICEFARYNLKNNGKLYFEINEYLGKDTVQLLENYNFKAIELKKDLFGRDRIIRAVKQYDQ